jgi:hypothetical protein
MRVDDGKCCRCGADCDGSFMRMDPRRTRVREMLTQPEVPRFSGGGIALCYWCQRSVYFANGFLELLSKDLKRGVRPAHTNRSGYEPRLDKWDRIVALSAAGKRVAEIAIECDTTASTIYDVLRKTGIPTPCVQRKASRRAAVIERFGQERAQHVVAMRLGGQSWDQIAARLGEKREAVIAAHISVTRKE